MPPDDGGGKLPDSVIHDFEAWVRMGAPDPRIDPIGGGFAGAGQGEELGYLGGEEVVGVSAASVAIYAGGDGFGVVPERYR